MLQIKFDCNWPASEILMLESLDTQTDGCQLNPYPISSPLEPSAQVSYNWPQNCNISSHDQKEKVVSFVYPSFLFTLNVVQHLSVLETLIRREEG